MTTLQEKFWESEFGDEYTQRNFFVPEDLDASYITKYGVTRTRMNKEFLGSLSIESVLEVGANMGAQLRTLQKMHFDNLYGIEINREAIEKSKKNSHDLNIIKASAFDIPFRDNYFDLVFTSGVLIHISPRDIAKALDEIYRTTKKYIWGFEYFSETHDNIEYRGHTDRLWRGNFAQMYLDRFHDMKLIKQNKYKYVTDSNVDAMFLLEKINK